MKKKKRRSIGKNDYVVFCNGLRVSTSMSPHVSLEIDASLLLLKNFKPYVYYGSLHLHIYIRIYLHVCLYICVCVRIIRLLYVCVYIYVNCSYKLVIYIHVYIDIDKGIERGMFLMLIVKCWIFHFHAKFEDDIKVKCILFLEFLHVYYFFISCSAFTS